MVHPLIRVMAAGALALGLGVSPAAADATPHVHLSTATQMAANGTRERVAFRFAIAPGWHIYWKNPGETGLPTTVAWTLPKDVRASALQWPVPERFKSGTLVNYGYAGDTTILAPLSLPSHPEGTSARAAVNWLLCAQMCIPESATLTVPLGRTSGDPALFRAGDSPMPHAFPGKARASVSAHAITLDLDDPQLTDAALKDVTFFPATRRAIDDTAAPRIARTSAGLRITFRRYRHLHALSAFSGVLAVTGKGAWTVQASAAPAAAPPAPAATPAATQATAGLVGAMLFAFLGGLILNLMPCVLPVLSMKALAFAQARENAAELRREGLFYFAGVIASFAVTAGALLALRAAGHEAGWGFQLQSPGLVALLALLCAGVGLNFLGVFEMPAALAGIGGGLASAGSAGRRAFFTGVLAVIVASPCTAPFMGSAMGFALTEPAAIGMAVFLALATGFALPFTALTFLPGLVRLIPKPGRWMIVLKEFLAFPMFATAVWLVWVVAQEAGAGGVAVTLGGATALGFLMWLFSKLTRRGARVIGAAGGAAILAGLVVAMPQAVAERSTAQADGWRPWSRAAVAQARAAGHPVFVDFGAAWCVTCLVNERVALDDPAVRKAFAHAGVATFKADWTNRDAKIAEVLSRYGRAGVPLYLFYPAGHKAQPTILPQLLSPSTVLAALTAPRS